MPINALESTDDFENFETSFFFHFETSSRLRPAQNKDYFLAVVKLYFQCLLVSDIGPHHTATLDQSYDGF